MLYKAEALGEGWRLDQPTLAESAEEAADDHPNKIHVFRLGNDYMETLLAEAVCYPWKDLTPVPQWIDPQPRGWGKDDWKR